MLGEHPVLMIQMPCDVYKTPSSNKTKSNKATKTFSPTQFATTFAETISKFKQNSATSSSEESSNKKAKIELTDEQKKSTRMKTLMSLRASAAYDELSEHAKARLNEELEEYIFN